MLHIIKNKEAQAQCASCSNVVKEAYILSLPIGKIPLCKDCYEQLKTDIVFLDAGAE